jgi:hypothetical protein
MPVLLGDITKQKIQGIPCGLTETIISKPKRIDMIIPTPPLQQPLMDLFEVFLPS